MKRFLVTSLLLTLCVLCSAQDRLVVPPSDSAPEDWTRIPYYESRPEFTPTDVEQSRGFALYTRPLVDAIYPESRPGAEERVESLRFFGAWNQFQTLNFAVYPLRELKDLRVTAGAFTSGANGENVFPAENIQIRLVTYRDIRYPMYSSKTRQYRVLPEYLQDITTTDAPAGVSQRYFLTFEIPENLPGGVYSGEIAIRCEGLDVPVTLPVALEVRPYKLLKDPTKHYSAYYYPPQRHRLVTSGQRDLEWASAAQRKEFGTMRDYGFDRSPVLQMQFSIEEDKFYIPEFDKWLDLLHANGMEGPIPVIGGGVSWLASKWYGVRFGSHLSYDKEPPAEFYDRIQEYCVAFRKECEEKGYPEMVFGPLDEVSPESTPFGVGVYKAFHDAGLTTYTTKEPMDSSFQTYDPYIDIFASQVLLPKYEEVVGGHKKAYWCYPNHNSYERKDMVIMCRGGRMTYGFGFWRSGFDLLIPWIWRNGSPDHFNLESSGGANIFHPETGDMIMTTYWECFREGMNDLRYLYTLETAVVQREGSSDPEVQRLTSEARALLQEIWDSIRVQDKYLSKDLWESTRFDEYRTRMATLISELYKYPALNENVAPSVIIEPRIIEFPDATVVEVQKHLAAGTLKKVTIPFENCRAEEDEAKLEIVDSPAGAQNAQCALLTVSIDTTRDGSSAKGPYPSNWPALGARLKCEEIAKPKALLLRFRVESNRAAEYRGKSPIHVGVRPAWSVDYAGEVPESEWVTAIIPLAENLYDGIRPSDAFPSGIRLTISESRYHHGDVVKFYFDEISLVDYPVPGSPR